MTPTPPQTSSLTPAEQAKREGLRARKPHVAAKLAAITEMEERGEISPIIRLEKSYLCNFQCTHCSAEYYMERHQRKVFKIEDTRRKIDLGDIRELSRQADELGLARFVITGGEPLVMKDFDAVVEAIDPDKHYVITDTNGWFLDAARAKHLKSIGVEKVQLSLDSMIEAEHDAFRNKPGSYKKVMRAIDASLDAGLNLLLSTVLVKGRAKSPEFLEMCKFATARNIGLYVSYAKPTGSCTNHPEFVIEKEDADFLRELEKEYNVFTHMTPSYGSFKGCITTKGIITVTSTFEVTPCPYIDFSLGNLRETPLKEVLARGMRNPWLGPYRPDCIIGEDPMFIELHMEKTKGVTHLPVPWGQGFADEAMPSRPDDKATPTRGASALFDEQGRCIPAHLTAPAIRNSRHYFKLTPPQIDYAAIHARAAHHLGVTGISAAEFKERSEAVMQALANDPACSRITHGVAVPFLLPQAKHDNYGKAMEQHYIPAVGHAFADAFPQYRFANHNHSPLVGQLSIKSGSRHDRLVQAMQQGPVVGCYFPCLTEYSLPAALERVQALPEQFLLAGGYDTSAALVGTPGLLQRTDGYPPLLWLAAVQAEKPPVGYYYEAYGYNLTFNRRPHFGEAAEYWASGLVVLG